MSYPVKLAASQSDFDENGQLKLTEKTKALKVSLSFLTDLGSKRLL